MGHFLGVVEFVGDVFAFDYGDVWVLRMGFVDQGDGCFVVFCCHLAGVLKVLDGNWIYGVFWRGFR